jgi:hypothetical protein
VRKAPDTIAARRLLVNSSGASGAMDSVAGLRAQQIPGVSDVDLDLDLGWDYVQSLVHEIVG